MKEPEVQDADRVGTHWIGARSRRCDGTFHGFLLLAVLLLSIKVVHGGSFTYFGGVAEVGDFTSTSSSGYTERTQTRSEKRQKRKKRRTSRKKSYKRTRLYKMQKRGLDAENAGRLNEAEAAYREALDMKPGSDWTRDRLVSVLVDKAHDFIAGYRIQDGLAVYREVLTLRPNHQALKDLIKQIERHLREDALAKERRREAGKRKKAMLEKVDRLRFSKGSRHSAPVLTTQGPLDWESLAPRPTDSMLELVRADQKRINAYWSGELVKMKDLQRRINKGGEDGKAALREAQRHVVERAEERFERIQADLRARDRALLERAAKSSLEEMEAALEQEMAHTQSYIYDSLMSEMLAQLSPEELGQVYGIMPKEAAGQAEPTQDDLDAHMIGSLVSGIVSMLTPAERIELRKGLEYGFAVDFALTLESNKIQRARAQACRDMRRAYTLLEQSGMLEEGEDLVRKTRTDPAFRERLEQARDRVLRELEFAERHARHESLEWLTRKFEELDKEYPDR